jgi:hypothetical protein
MLLRTFAVLVVVLNSSPGAFATIGVSRRQAAVLSVIASEAKQSRDAKTGWIASSLRSSQ